MARLRVFVSSTFYDLRHVRGDLERFIRELGYDPILHERGQIPYGKEEELENYCYREISNCDILVSIIGSRFGTQSRHEESSISQVELRTALKIGKQVYIFVEKAIEHEFRTYLKNKDNTSVKYAAADDIRIYEFIATVRSMQNNNVMQSFESIEEICSFLREQWAGLFQRLLGEQIKAKEFDLINDMKSTVRTLNELVEFVANERQNSNEAIQQIIFSNHPAFAQLAKLAGVRYRVYFTDYTEMGVWLEARSYRKEQECEWEGSKFETWLNTDKKIERRMTIDLCIFDSHSKLRSYTPRDWEADFITLSVTNKTRPKPPPADDLDDDIPF